MEGLLGWTTPFIWTMPGLLFVAFPVPFPAGLPAEGLLVAALPLTAFLRDIFQDFKSIFMKPGSSRQQPKANWTISDESVRGMGWKVAAEKKFNLADSSTCALETCSWTRFGRCESRFLLLTDLQTSALRAGVAEVMWQKTPPWAQSSQDRSLSSLPTHWNSKLWLHRWLLYLVTSARLNLEKTKAKNRLFQRQRQRMALLLKPGEDISVLLMSHSESLAAVLFFRHKVRSPIPPMDPLHALYHLHCLFVLYAPDKLAASWWEQGHLTLRLIHQSLRSCLVSAMFLRITTIIIIAYWILRKGQCKQRCGINHTWASITKKVK